MKIDRDLIKKFQRIYFEEFGERISEQEAYERFSRLLRLLRIILQPIPTVGRMGGQPAKFDHEKKHDKMR